MITLYHGSTQVVKLPLVGVGRANVDFGSGFYLTKHKRQAIEWARIVAGRRLSAVPVLNEYVYDNVLAKKMAGKRYKDFGSYSLEWLEYVIDCRQKGKLQRKYDVVKGGVANDKVIDTVEDFERGIITAEQALGQLRYRKVNHQTAILSQAILDSCLKFKRSVEIR